MLLMSLLGSLGLDYGHIRFLPDSGNSSNALINCRLTIGRVGTMFISFIFYIGFHFG